MPIASSQRSAAASPIAWAIAGVPASNRAGGSAQVVSASRSTLGDYAGAGTDDGRVALRQVRWQPRYENQKLVEEALREAGREDLLPKFQHALKQRNRSAKKEGATETDLDTCG